jgi:DNA-binding GntR family transcriptional regulator
MIAANGAAVDVTNTATRAFTELRQLIVRGHLPPGSWIVEAHVAERLGLSRTPVRAALQRLQQEGYVVSQPGARRSRVLIAPLTREDARELYAIVGHIEEFAAPLIAVLPPRQRAALGDQLAAFNGELHEIAGRTPADPRRVFDIDKAFHATLVAAAGGTRLGVLHQTVTPQVERYWRLYASSIINELHLSVAEHDEIIRGTRKGDAAIIAAGLRKNWAGGFERISRLIEVFGERGSW